MSTKPQTNPDDQEIDLSDISRKMGQAFQSLNAFIFNCIQFAVKNIIILVILLIVGVGLGFYLDKTQKTYDHQIIVKPNFNSVDYLYSRIDLLSAKIKEKDTAFLKSKGINDPSKLAKIEIEPIVDIYRFINVSSKEQNFQLLKLMAEDGDIRKIVEEPTTSKNYTYHSIKITTKNTSTDKGTIQPLLAYLNDNEYYKKVQVEAINNTQLKMKANEQIIAQIDGFLNELSNKPAGSSVYINENTQLNDVIQTKDNLLDEQGYHRIELVGMDKIVKEINVTTNIENNASVNGKLKFILPIFFIFVFILIRMFRSFYRSQSRKIIPTV